MSEEEDCGHVHCFQIINPHGEIVVHEEIDPDHEKETP